MGLFKRTFTERGAPPGTIVPPDAFVEPELHVISYTSEAYAEHDVGGPADVRTLLRTGRVVWIDVHGIGDGSIVRDFGDLLELHPLAVADVVHFGQRPKVELYDGVLFVVVPMATLQDDGSIGWEQVSLFLGEDYVLTFQERPGDCLDPLRERIRQGRRPIRTQGADYLACMVIDAIVDGYFPILEHGGGRLEEFEEQILVHPTQAALMTLYEARRDLLTFRRAIWPLRDALRHLMQEEDFPISPSARLYLRDTTDHAMQVVEVNETYRELAASLLEVYLSMVGQRTNDIMRVLTVMASIFIPLTFVAGVYGMNFDTDRPLNMPELGWSLGYVYFWGLCAGIVALLMFVFRRLGWLGSAER